MEFLDYLPAVLAFVALGGLLVLHKRWGGTGIRGDYGPRFWSDD